MHMNQKIAIGIAVGAVTLSVMEFKKIQREERAKRAKIAADTAEEIIVIHRAAAVMTERLRRGDYDRNLNLDTVMTDFKFEQIVQHEK